MKKVSIIDLAMISGYIVLLLIFAFTIIELGRINKKVTRMCTNESYLYDVCNISLGGISYKKVPVSIPEFNLTPFQLNQTHIKKGD